MNPRSRVRSHRTRLSSLAIPAAILAQYAEQTELTIILGDPHYSDGLPPCRADTGQSTYRRKLTQLDHMKPKAKYPKLSTFGKRILDCRDDKALVAQRIAKEFVGDGSSTFIADGSSTFHVALAVFSARRDVEITTNNLGIAHEFALWNSGRNTMGTTSVTLTPGIVSARLMMALGDQTLKFTRQYVENMTSVILSVKRFFADEGPAGSDSPSLAVKMAALRVAIREQKLILFVADYKKFTSNFERSAPLIFPVQQQWQDLIKQPNVFVVTSKHPDATPDEEVNRARRKPSNELDYYIHHARKLRAKMGKRFVEVMT